MCPRTSGLVWKFMVSLLSFYPKKRNQQPAFLSQFDGKLHSIDGASVCANVTWFNAFVWPLTVFMLCRFVKTMDDGKVIVLQNKSNNGPNNSGILNRDILEISANCKKCWYATIITLIISSLVLAFVFWWWRSRWKRRNCAPTQRLGHTHRTD